MIGCLAPALPGGGFVFLIRGLPGGFLSADLFEFRKRPAEFAGEDERIVRHAEARRDLHINPAEEMGFHGVGQMAVDEERLAVASRHIRYVDVQRVFAVSSVCRFHGDGVGAVHSLVPDGGIDLARLEVFSENRFVLG
jgi:hypothetical protein